MSSFLTLKVPAKVKENVCRVYRKVLSCAHSFFLRKFPSVLTMSPQLRFAYELSMGIESKLEAVACTIYGARNVELSPLAKTQAERFERQGYGRLAVCIAKTPLSLSHDPKLLGSPRDFVLPVRELRLSAGAGFVYALAGDVTTMPGLPTRPALMDIDLDLETGAPVGLF